MRAYRIAYDGRPFHGFQRQPTVATVSDALLDGLVEADVIDAPGDGARSRPVPPGYAAAGRTDAGVSALAQTVAFDAPDWLTPRRFSALVPEEIAVYASSEVGEDFHATHDARARRYRYFLRPPSDVIDREPRPASEGDSRGAGESAGEAPEPVAVSELSAPAVDPRPIDGGRVTPAAVARARRAARSLSGTNDYHNLTPDETGTERSVEIVVEPCGPTLAVDVTAAGFPRELVRRLATLLRAATADRLPEGRIERLLGPEPVDGPAGVGPASPEPLVLLAVAYDESFTPDEAAIEDAQRAFGSTAREAAMVARVNRLLADGLDVDSS